MESRPFRGTTPIVRGNSVTFICDAPKATMVNVLGTFNHWDLPAGVMERDPSGVWKRTFDVPLEGSYDYKFLIDGEWHLDPLNPDYGKDHRDRYNSRFLIASSARGVQWLGSIAEGLSLHPPGSRSLERPAFFSQADRLLQLPTAARSRVVRDHMYDRLIGLIRRLREGREDLLAGVYCHGNILRRGGTTIGIDVVTTRSVWGLYWDIPLQVVEDIARSLDALFVSHLHPDHLDPHLIQAMLEQRKPVYVPLEAADRFPEGVRGVPADDEVEIKQWSVTFHKGIHVYDERRMLILRYFELVGPDGYRVLHTTDHDYSTGIKIGGPADLLIAKAGGISPLVDNLVAFRNLVLHLQPRKFVTGHLNELGHDTGAGREPFATGWEIIRQNAQIEGEVLYWGEVWPL